MRCRDIALGLGVIAILLAPAAALGADPIVVSVWGGNWKDTVERVVAKPFTAKTGIPVEFEVGGTLDRLAKARVSKAAPLVDVTFTTTHVGRLYISDGLYQKLDLTKLPNAKDLAKEAIRSDSHIGVWVYVYTIAYRPDQVQGEITKWADLWDPKYRGKIALPDFDPSHIITISALLEGGDEVNWQKGQERLKRLKPSIAAFYSTDARSQDLMKTGEAPIEVMLSINAFHLIDQGLKVKVVNPTDKPGIVGIDTMGIMAGTKKSDAAHQFVNFALGRDIQEQLVAAFKAGSPRDVYERPATRFVADFIGASSVLDARAIDGETVELPGGARLRVVLTRAPVPGRALRLLVRPERVELGGVGPNTLGARVVGVMYLGDHSELRLELPGGQRLLAIVRGSVSLSSGETVTAGFALDAFLDVS